MMFGLDLSRCKGGIMVDISEEEERDFFFWEERLNEFSLKSFLNELH